MDSLQLIVGAFSNVSLDSFPGGGLGIYTDIDQRSIFGGFEFGESVFFWATGRSCCIFWVVK